MPVRNIKEFIALAKQRPGQIQYATGGAGTANHIAAEAIRLASGINIEYIGSTPGQCDAFLREQVPVWG
ncbi:MAG: hypothetical protein HYY78_07225 [Betaproteobacteria bacterium]|nr:hypothetical protein [Betaproteobacteria bacterium]